MTKNQFEHNMIFVEVGGEEVGDKAGQMLVTAVAVDLDPNTPVTMRELSMDEIGDDMNAFIDGARESMDALSDRLVEQVLAACRENRGPIDHFGMIELVEQLEQAPHLLLANMMAALIASCAETVVNEPDQVAAN